MIKITNLKIGKKTRKRKYGIFSHETTDWKRATKKDEVMVAKMMKTFIKMFTHRMGFDIEFDVNVE